MAVVFLEGGRSPIPMRWRAPSSIVDPVVRYVNSCIVKRKDSQIPKRNSLLNLDYLVAQHCVVEISTKNNHQKITMTTVKTNKFEEA